jgi:hypothetical protein
MVDRPMTMRMTNNYDPEIVKRMISQAPIGRFACREHTTKISKSTIIAGRLWSLTAMWECDALTIEGWPEDQLLITQALAGKLRSIVQSRKY